LFGLVRGGNGQEPGARRGDPEVRSRGLQEDTMTGKGSLWERASRAGIVFGDSGPSMP